MVPTPPRPLPPPFDEVLSAETLDREPASVCLIDERGVIVFVNRAWDRFATENDGLSVLTPGILGRRWLDGIVGDEPRRLFEEALVRAFGSAWNAPRTVLVHSECHSPTEARDLVTQLVPVSSTDRSRTLGVLALYQIIGAEPIERRYTLHSPDERRHRDAHGFLLQCCGCRRVQVRSERTWEFVPDYVAHHPKSVSHGVCSVCLELFYGREIAERARERASREPA